WTAVPLPTIATSFLLSVLGDLFDASFVRSHFECHRCPYRRFQPHAGTTADQCAAPPLGISRRDMRNGYLLYPPGGYIKTSGHRDPVIEPVHQPFRNRDHVATLSPFPS